MSEWHLSVHKARAYLLTTLVLSPASSFIAGSAGTADGRSIGARELDGHDFSSRVLFDDTGTRCFWSGSAI